MFENVISQIKFPYHIVKKSKWNILNNYQYKIFNYKNEYVGIIYKDRMYIIDDWYLFKRLKSISDEVQFCSSTGFDYF